METSKTYNGIDLLNRVLEFVAMTPNDREWNYKSLSHNKSRLIRFQQIKSLVNAFSLNIERSKYEGTSNYFNPDLKAEIKSILKGDFLKGNKMEDYDELNNVVSQFLKQNNYNLDRPIKMTELNFIYPKMVNFKSKLLELKDFNSGFLEANSSFTIFHIMLTNFISSNLINNSNDLDNVLELLINPKRKSFTEKELIEKFGFPSDDLNEIDIDNY